MVSFTIAQNYSINQDDDVFWFHSPPLQYEFSESKSSCLSFDAPSFSPVVSSCSSEVKSLCDEEQNDIEEVDNHEEACITGHVNLRELPLTPKISADQLHTDLLFVGVDEALTSTDNVADVNVGSESMHVTEEFPVISWPGFKIVIDNVDKNFRPSFKRHDNKTISMHACNMYACQDRIDFSFLSDVNPSSPQIDGQKLLIAKADIEALNGDLAVLSSR